MRGLQALLPYVDGRMLDGAATFASHFVALAKAVLAQRPEREQHRARRHAPPLARAERRRIDQQGLMRFLCLLTAL